MPTINENTTPTPSDDHSEGLLPAFSAKQYSHLPTPQSPNNDARYGYDRPYSPESPITNGMNSASSSSFQNRRQVNRPLTNEEGLVRAQTNLQQCVTPESSPHFSHISPAEHSNSTTPRYFLPPSSNDFTTPKQNSSKDGNSRKSNSSNSNTQMATPSSPPMEHPSHSSALSSPFMAKLSIGEKISKGHAPLPNGSLPSQVDDVFSPARSATQMATSTSSVPLIPPVTEVAPNPTVSAGGEMERIRQSMMADRLAHIQEAEKHRPEYLKRSKRTLSEADPLYLLEDENTSERVLPVGIMESPHKGRRLKLFQETSEESFEESLMAGGYGRYRTADWVRQPQPISLPPSAVAGSSTSIVSLLEEAEEAPPSEKELKKRKRLAAFRVEPTQSNSKLCTVELEGKGRVLIDRPTEEQIAPGSPEPAPSKKKAPNRRKKKVNDVVVNKKSYGTDLQNQTDKPNWPDSEFPWRLRTEERLEMAKAEEEERLHWIERFLDRDSDDEDEAESGDAAHAPDLDYEHLSDMPRPGRGKMVPLMAYPHPTGKDDVIRRATYPSDPADARAALLAKRSVRALMYRQQRRQRELDDEDDEEVVCICNGKDDGRELVQCDACQTWYHLQCIGIRNIAELGKEEDPWFCRRCVSRSRSPSTEPEVSTGEPTFVPTDEEHSFRRSSDTPFFQPGPHDSPNWAAMKTPRTPPREYGAHSDSHNTWLESSRPGPSTPQYSATSVRIYSSPYNGYMNSDDSPFDPTSTPSRGIKFNAPFTTPKNVWPARPIFQSPTRPQGTRGSGYAANYSNYNRADGPHSMSNSTREDSHGGSHHPHNQDYYGRPNHYDESPVRRGDLYKNSVPRRTLHSPPAAGTARSRGGGPYVGPSPGVASYLEESPVMRSLGSRLQKEPPAHT
ncbi:hypothetical protein CVT25_014961 [Psilocybe cyanescens]|uniref:PHD-type domain-containing protein n=1 Tax=Psilocybe cyanescens TaxID=93625 RepID=A0A409XI57_PSICY|nr:hypothetical protein CVT25_014961 [Psilocybe cyanescens]